MPPLQPAPPHSWELNPESCFSRIPVRGVEAGRQTHPLQEVLDILVRPQLVQEHRRRLAGFGEISEKTSRDQEQMLENDAYIKSQLKSEDFPLFSEQIQQFSDVGRFCMTGLFWLSSFSELIKPPFSRRLLVSGSLATRKLAV